MIALQQSVVSTLRFLFNKSKRNSYASMTTLHLIAPFLTFKIFDDHKEENTSSVVTKAFFFQFAFEVTQICRKVALVHYKNSVGFSMLLLTCLTSFDIFFHY